MSDGTDWFSDETATFGDRLAGARQATGMSQGILARRIGVKPKTLRAWEEDLAEPRANRLQMLSGLLGVSLPWLMTGEGEGLDGPVEDTTLPDDMLGILTEIRQMRTDMRQGVDRLARLEKKLRKTMEDQL